MAKGLAGGFPLSAVTGRAEIVDAAPVGGIGGTYAGNPLAVAAANAVLDVIEEEDLCARAIEIGEAIRVRLTDIAARQGMEPIGDVRGLGAMMAFELVTDRKARKPDTALAQAIVAEAEARGADHSSLRYVGQRRSATAATDHTDAAGRGSTRYH